jgi:valyl-tRNA synthetase
MAPAIPRPGAPLVERWIASRLSAVTTDLTRLIGEFNFGEAGREIHDFVWDEVADWYVEAFKILARDGRSDGALLAQVFEKILRLLHPLAPFVTEALWQRLTTGMAERPLAIMVAPWPEAADVRDPAAEADWADVMALTRAVRALRADYGIEPARAVSATIVPGSAERAAFWNEHAPTLAALPGVRLGSTVVQAQVDEATAARSVAAVAAGAEVLIDAAGLFDVRDELRRAERELAQAAGQVQRLERQLASEFSQKAPPEVVQAERERLEQQRERLQTLQRRQETLRRLDAA